MLEEAKKIIFCLFGLALGMGILASPEQQVVAAARLDKQQPRPLRLYPLSDHEFEFIKTLRLATAPLAPRRPPSSRVSPARELFGSNNGPDVALVVEPASGNNNRLRFQRSLESISSSAAAVAAQFPVQQSKQQAIQIYQDEQAFKRQLPDLIAQAHNDKALERALLRMLINTSLSASLPTGGQRHAGTNSAASASASGSSSAPVGGSLSGSDLSNLDEGAVSSIKQMEPASLVGVDPFGALGSLELANGRQISSPDQEGFLAANNVDKRESKPCLFNAIDCLRNPYGRNSEI